VALSARNQLPGIIQAIQYDEVVALVVMKVGSQMVESVIARATARDLGLKVGDSVKVVIKSTEVMIQKG